MEDTNMRYHVVVVSKYTDWYGRDGNPTAFAIADNEQANSIVSRNYDSRFNAERDAARLNKDADERAGFSR